MESIDKLAEQLSGMQDAMISLQKDRNIDDKKIIHRQGKIITILAALLAVVSMIFIGLMSWTNVQHENSLKELAESNDKRFLDFMSEYDFETIYETNASVNGNSSMTDSANIGR